MKRLSFALIIMIVLALVSHQLLLSREFKDTPHKTSTYRKKTKTQIPKNKAPNTPRTHNKGENLYERRISKLYRFSLRVIPFDHEDIVPDLVKITHISNDKKVITAKTINENGQAEFFLKSGIYRLSSRYLGRYIRINDSDVTMTIKQKKSATKFYEKKEKEITWCIRGRVFDHNGQPFEGGNKSAYIRLNIGENENAGLGRFYKDQEINGEFRFFISPKSEGFSAILSVKDFNGKICFQKDIGPIFGNKDIEVYLQNHITKIFNFQTDLPPNIKLVCVIPSENNNRIQLRKNDEGKLGLVNADVGQRYPGIIYDSANRRWGQVVFTVSHFINETYDLQFDNYQWVTVEGIIQAETPTISPQLVYLSNGSYRFKVAGTNNKGHFKFSTTTCSVPVTITIRNNENSTYDYASKSVKIQSRLDRLILHVKN